MSTYTLTARLIRAVLIGVALGTVLLVTAEGAATFTEFYCTSGGSNLNSGSTSGSPAYTSTGGNWTQTTRTFTPTDGSNPSLSCAVGDFAAVYVTSGATVATFVGRLTTVTNATNGTLVISATNNAGTNPANGTGTMTIKVGGAWKGPNGSTTFPFNLSFTNLINTSGNFPRLNLKNDQTYSMTVGLTFTGLSATVEGYTTNPGDGGKAIIDDGGSNTVVLTANSGNQTFQDLILQNTLASGSTAGGFVIGTNQNSIVYRVVVHSVGGIGMDMTGTANNSVIESEVYDACKANGAGCNAMSLSTTLVKRSIVHNNRVNGFGTAGSSGFNEIYHCVAALNGALGLSVGATNGTNLGVSVENTDFYGNGSDAIKFVDTTASSRTFIRNCNFVLNHGYGVNTALTTGHLYGFMDNCGFGSGSMANTSGTTNNTDTLIINGSVTYASGVTPWTNPDYINFNINLAAAEGTGRGAFTETGNVINNPTPTPTASGTPTPYPLTVGYPDIGAADAQIGEPFPTPTFTPTATATATATSTATATPTATATAAATATATATATPTAPIEVSYGFSQ